MKYPAILQYEYLPVPVHLFVENRPNSRISLLQKSINIRLPYYIRKNQRQVELEKLLHWAQKHIQKTGMYAGEHRDLDYRNVDNILVSGHLWSLRFIQDELGSGIRSRVDAHERCIYFFGRLEGEGAENAAGAVRELLIRNFKNIYAKDMAERVSTINDRTVKLPFRKVVLKYTKSRWGSCSVKGDINLSLRLLLLPEEVRDYVILHELAHLRHMNHSQTYWKLVARHIPDYKTHENWLRINGHLYDF
jgi:predicted metal-dependent hydrolase